MNRYLLAGLVLAVMVTNFNLCAGKLWKVSKPKKAQPGLCYDCDYDPDDAQAGQEKTGGKKGGDERRGYGSKAPGGKSSDGRRGFPRCALDSGDERFVRLSECHSSVCFIRRDHNGLVYRGCADSRNLPLGVDSSVQCRKQGRLPAVWWFCNGTLCNSGQFSTVCSADSKNGNSGTSCDPYATTGPALAGYPPVQSPSKKPKVVPPHPAGYGSQQAFQTHPAPVKPSPSQKYPPPPPPPPPPSYPPPPAEPAGYGGSSTLGGDGGAAWTYDDQEDTEQSAYQSGQSSASEEDDDPTYRTWDFLLLAKSRLERLGDSVDWASANADDQDDDRKSSGTGYDVMAPTGYGNSMATSSGYGTTNGVDDEANPCDHKCVDNPSALFADPSRPDGFIQCGPGVNYEVGVVCHCCIPYWLTCSAGAHFDPVAKVCTNGKAVAAAAAQGGNKPGVIEYVH